jgi:hypothetical protein
VSLVHRFKLRVLRVTTFAVLVASGFTESGGTVAHETVSPSFAFEGARDHSHDGLNQFRRLMPKTVRSDHPAILPVAMAIRAVTSDPLEQIVMVNDVTHLLVDYDNDERVYGRSEYHATLDEMIARRRQAGWVYLRDDCDGRAVFAAHLLASLGIPWRLQASYWRKHAWVIAHVGGVDYDLLASGAPESAQSGLSFRLVGRHFVNATHTPPLFRWRQAWSDRTHNDLETGKRLGLLELDSNASRARLRSSTDWTKVHPQGILSPMDPRTLTATIAAFPLGDTLRPDSLVQNGVGTR